MLKLDIIVTHYKEDWSVGKKFFDMLALQRGIDFKEFRVTIVHDGTDAFRGNVFKFYPFEVRQVEVAHGGVSHARNVGIQKAEAPWICFCDFDDTFSSLYSMRHILTLLPNDDVDILWTDFYSEDLMKSGEMLLHRRRENCVFIHGKYFRREFILQNDLTFPEDLEFNEDSAFCAVAYAYCESGRIAKIKTEVPLYIWVYREGSATATKGNRWKCYKGLYYRNKKVCEVFKKRLPRYRYLTMVCRACYDAFHMLNVTNLPEELNDVYEDFRAFWKEHKAEFLACDPKERALAAQASKREHDAGDQEEEARWGTGGDLFFDRSVSFTEWIRKVEGNGRALAENRPEEAAGN